MAFSIEAGNDILTFKEATSKPARLEFVEATRNKIGAQEIDKPWILIKRRELNGKKNIISIWYFKRKRAPDERLIKQKAHMRV